MNPLAETAIKAMLADGITFRVSDDLPDLIELHDLAQAALSGLKSEEYRALLQPELHIGGLVLRRMSAGAKEFLQDLPGAWYADDPEMYLKSLCYCMAVGREPGALWSLADEKQWRKAIKWWIRTIGVSLEELSLAVKEFQGIQEKADAELQAKSLRPASADLGWLFEGFCATYGEPPEFWVWKVDEATLVMLLNRFRVRMHAERQAADGGKAGNTDPDLPGVKALYHFRTKEEAIIKRKQAEMNRG